MARLLTIRRDRPRVWADTVLAGVLVALGESQVWLGWGDGGVGGTPHGHEVARALLMIGFTVPLAWRRRRPLAALLVICVSMVVQLLLVVPQVPFVVGLLPMAIANYSAAAYAARSRPTGLLLVLGVEAIIYARIPEERAGGELIFSLCAILGTWAVGDMVRERVARADRQVAAAHQLVVEQETAAAAALAEERTRIARELHDVIAHSVSLMGVQAGAARTLLATDPNAALDALRNVEATARLSVAELQRLLVVLRAGSPESVRTPQPGLGQVPELIDQLRTAGLPVELVRCAAVALPPGVDLAAYRIVQEALTNALKHSGAETTVDVCDEHGVLTICVRNVAGGLNGRAAGAGHGLIGMRERTQLYGGKFDAHHTDDGGFVVQAAIPLAAGERV